MYRTCLEVVNFAQVVALSSSIHIVNVFSMAWAINLWQFVRQTKVAKTQCHSSTIFLKFLICEVIFTAVLLEPPLVFTVRAGMYENRIRNLTINFQKNMNSILTLEIIMFMIHHRNIYEKWNILRSVASDGKKFSEKFHNSRFRYLSTELFTVRKYFYSSF